MRNAKKTTPHIAASAVGNSMTARIIGAAFLAFLEHGYAETTMLEIATRAKVSKRDLYANFSSKQAILLACIADRAARMRLQPDLPVPRDRREFETIVIAFGTTVIREVNKPAVMAMFRFAIAEAENSPEVAETLNSSRSVNRGAFAALLARTQASGILGPGDPEHMMEQYFGLLWRDLMLSRLLGLAASPKPAQIDRKARDAAAAFLRLYGDPTQGDR
jgi:AcrR family transcriptional regulator